MNPKTIIASIERNHEVMTAQVEKLGELSPKPAFPTFNGTDTPANVATLLNAAVLGHLQGAADALHALAEVETNLRRPVEANQAERAKPRHTPEIIDVEATVINSEDKPK